MKNTKAPMELLGLSGALNPLTQQVTSDRLDMFRSHAGQALMIKDTQPPYVMSGLETHLGDYERLGDVSGAREQDGVVLAIIPKYGSGTISENIINDPPVKTVIYVNESGEIDYMNADQYFIGNEGFGFEIDRSRIAELGEGSVIDKEEILCRSPGRKKDGSFGYGLNANVAYMSGLGTIEDAMIISKSFAKRATVTQVGEIEIPINPTEYPLNIFGDDVEPAFLVNIGDTVGEDGVLCALRRAFDDTIFADLTTQEIDYLTDTVYRLPPGAKIVDVDFYTSPTTDSYHWDVFAQVDRYVSAKMLYLKKIIDVYRQYKGTHGLTPRFNTLVTNSFLHLQTYESSMGAYKRRGRPIPFVSKKNVAVEFLQIHVKYTIELELKEGFKLSDCMGTKGVVSQILPDEQMPLDRYGQRAEVIVDPGSAISRMNPAQIYLPTINYASYCVTLRLGEYLQQNKIKEAWSLLLDYYNDVNPEYRELIEQTLTSANEQLEHLQECVDQKAITLWVPPFLDTMYIDDVEKSFMRKVKDKWAFPIKPVHHDLYSTGRMIETNEPVMIGSKYMVILNKVPKQAASGFTHLSSHGIPAHAGKTAKSKFPHSSNPVRMGEDEIRCLMHDLPTEEIRRFLLINGSSVDATQKQMETILNAEDGSKINRVQVSQDILDRSDIPEQILKHSLTVVGVDINQKEEDL